MTHPSNDKCTSAAQRALQQVLLLVLMVGLCTACQSKPVLDKPPIIIIDIDTLRASHLGYAGYPRPTSPNIDRLATESIQFLNAFSQAPNTLPSQTSIFTGLYPSAHGLIRGEDGVLSESVTTLAQVLSAAGYRTAAFVDGGFMSPNWGLDRGYDEYRSAATKGLKVLAPQVERWLGRHADETFLLLVHTYDVHSPYDPPEPYRSMFSQGLAPSTPGFEPTTEYLNDVRLAAKRGHPQPLSEQDLQYAMALYDGGIRYVDDWVGQFLAQIGDLGILERAIIVLISDHGEEFQEHGSVMHEKLYATVTHIPLLLRLPHEAAGRKIDHIVESIDVMPTLLELVGLAPPEGIHGRSLVPLLEGGERAPYRAYSESPLFGERRAVASGDFHYLVTLSTGHDELYDFRLDPLEQDALVEREPEVVQDLSSAIHAWQGMIKAFKRGITRSGVVDPEVEKQLRALGYLD